MILKDGWHKRKEWGEAAYYVENGKITHAFDGKYECWYPYKYSHKNGWYNVSGIKATYYNASKITWF